MDTEMNGAKGDVGQERVELFLAIWNMVYTPRVPASPPSFDWGIRLFGKLMYLDFYWVCGGTYRFYYISDVEVFKLRGLH